MENPLAAARRAVLPFCLAFLGATSGTSQIPELALEDQLRFRGGAVTALALSPGEDLLAVGGESGELLVLGLPGGEVRERWEVGASAVLCGALGLGNLNNQSETGNVNKAKTQ